MEHTEMYGDSNAQSSASTNDVSRTGVGTVRSQSIDRPQRLAEGGEKALAELGFVIDGPTPVPLNQSNSEAPTRRRNRWRLPTILLICTIISMTWAGIVAWSPWGVIEVAWQQGSLFEVRRCILSNWVAGLLFSVSLTAILGAHELGHYFVTRLYRIQSSLPLFIPFPINPIGTCGAVILMDGREADRKQIFDIGIAGPLAGLVFAIPIAAIGMMYEAPLETRITSIQFGQPLAIQWLAHWLSPSLVANGAGITNSAMNPMLMAAWVGLLVTGLNMMPISQLDGGHVIFGVFGRSSAYISWITYVSCVIYTVYNTIMFGQPEFILMLLLIPLMGIAHPPSRNDFVRLGLARQILGVTSLAIPLLCIPLRPFLFLM
jgi:Zn-dependent protease